MAKCDLRERNEGACNCTYAGCARKGQCCECLQYHLKKKSLPACCFPADAEKTYDRSFKKFIEVWSGRI